MAFSLVSTEFKNGEAIPSKYTCDADDVSPPLSWSDLPESAKSLVLIVEDPDAPDPAAPKMTWDHWLLYNVPVAASGLAEGVVAASSPAGTLEGTNSWGRRGYGGPCPPIGRHRYFFKLSAVGVVLPDLGHPSKADLMTAMEGHVLAEAVLMGTYCRD